MKSNPPLSSVLRLSHAIQNSRPSTWSIYTCHFLPHPRDTRTWLVVWLCDSFPHLHYFRAASISISRYLIAKLLRSRKKATFHLHHSPNAFYNYPTSQSFIGNDNITSNTTATKSMITAMGDCGDELFKVRRVPPIHAQCRHSVMY